jgi:MoaA/NifB/PqqE/SkfB family radical SAM enzyme
MTQYDQEFEEHWSSDVKHIDEWLDTPTFSDYKGEIYAKFVLDYKRMPAWKINAYAAWMEQFKLFCDYEGTRYRCTGASRMGDVWITDDFDQEHGYTLRVDVEKCSNWASKP